MRLLPLVLGLTVLSACGIEATEGPTEFVIEADDLFLPNVPDALSASVALVGDVHGFGLGWFQVASDFEIASASLVASEERAANVSAGPVATVSDLRGHYAWRRDPRPGEPISPNETGQWCLASFPPPEGFEISVPIEDLQPREGDVLLVSAYLEGAAPGDFNVTGIRIVAADGRVQTVDTRLVTFSVRGPDGPFPHPFDGPCTMRRTSGW